MLYQPHLEGKSTAIAFVTVGELYVLAERNLWGPDKVFELEAHLRTSVVIPYDVEICRLMRGLRPNLRTSSGSARVIRTAMIYGSPHAP